MTNTYLISTHSAQILFTRQKIHLQRQSNILNIYCQLATILHRIQINSYPLIFCNALYPDSMIKRTYQLYSIQPSFSDTSYQLPRANSFAFSRLVDVFYTPSIAHGEEREGKIVVRHRSKRCSTKCSETRINTLLDGTRQCGMSLRDKV